MSLIETKRMLVFPINSNRGKILMTAYNKLYGDKPCIFVCYFLLQKLGLKIISIDQLNYLNFVITECAIRVILY